MSCASLPWTTPDSAAAARAATAAARTGRGACGGWPTTTARTGRRRSTDATRARLGGPSASPPSRSGSATACARAGRSCGRSPRCSTRTAASPPSAARRSAPSRAPPPPPSEAARRIRSAARWRRCPAASATPRRRAPTAAAARRRRRHRGTRWTQHRCFTGRMRRGGWWRRCRAPPRCASSRCCAPPRRALSRTSACCRSWRAAARSGRR